ncbi:hypothetical protein [Methylobacterium sp. J-077]|uniref:hypothetical protein n=1 Tax=Methylobacterium sp. J-077 TaxID=2836656 RepID=UPI001FB8BDE3|nr:hypothetical protein [Methylobacterium sp. J-077]MCJ2121113.1 hypothetical protein [Methylobacterium sp. J-077]
MNDVDDDDKKQRYLIEIARALDVSIETFLDPSEFGDSHPSEAEQEDELLRLFRQVRDIEARRRCLGFVRALVDRPQKVQPD